MNTILAASYVDWTANLTPDPEPAPWDPPPDRCCTCTSPIGACWACHRHALLEKLPPHPSPARVALAERQASHYAERDRLRQIRATATDPATRAAVHASLATIQRAILQVRQQITRLTKKEHVSS